MYELNINSPFDHHLMHCSSKSFKLIGKCRPLNLVSTPGARFLFHIIFGRIYYFIYSFGSFFLLFCQKEKINVESVKCIPKPEANKF